jgi:hypothetical protein
LRLSALAGDKSESEKECWAQWRQGKKGDLILKNFSPELCALALWREINPNPKEN